MDKNPTSSVVSADMYDPQARAITVAISDALKAEFKLKVEEWLQNDKEKKRKMLEIKALNAKQKTLTQAIVAFMLTYQFEEVKLIDNIVKCKTSYVKTPLSQKTIRDKLFERFSDDENTTAKIKSVFNEDRAKVEKVALKRITL